MQTIVLCASAPWTLNFTSAVHQPRVRPHLPMAQVQSLKEMTVIGQSLQVLGVRLGARGKVALSDSAITKQMRFMRAGGFRGRSTVPRK